MLFPRGKENKLVFPDNTWLGGGRRVRREGSRGTLLGCEMSFDDDEIKVVVGRRIGVGGFGQVFEAIDANDPNKRYALNFF